MKKVSEEIIQQINEIYAETGVKKVVAERLGISPATVSKYIDPNYVPLSDRFEIKFDKQPPGCAAFHDFVASGATLEEKMQNFCSYCNLSEDEWHSMDMFSNYK